MTGQQQRTDICELCASTATLWASNRLRQPSAVGADRVWFESQAENAFQRSEFAEDSSGSQHDSAHYHSFIRAAMRVYDTQRERAEFGIVTQ